MPARLLMASLPAGDSPQVKVDVPASFLISVENIADNPIPHGIKGLKYTVRNTGDKTIIAFELMVEVSDGENIRRNPAYADMWGTKNGGLQPAGIDTGLGDLSMQWTTERPVTITISAKAVGFSDGTWIGPDADEFHGFLVASHKQILQESQKVESIMHANGVGAVMTHMKERHATPQGRWVNFFLSTALNDGGIMGLRAELDRLGSLAP